MVQKKEYVDIYDIYEDFPSVDFLISNEINNNIYIIMNAIISNKISLETIKDWIFHSFCQRCCRWAENIILLLSHKLVKQHSIHSELCVSM